ncbi:hypothetical protein [Streptomyces sp. NPDC056240]|uniref:hypothetical protein n=1 Tax=Streptomyces sp. NPDC056240 TaxID=3345759 RepID=UPI0035DB3D45
MAGCVRDDDADLCTTLVEPIADATGTGGAGRVRMARDEDSQSAFQKRGSPTGRSAR